MPQKQFTFVFTPDGNYGEDIRVQFMATPAGAGSFAVGAGFTQYSTIQGLKGGCTLTFDPASVTVQNFPVTAPIGPITGGSPTLTITVTVDAPGTYVQFDVGSLQAPIAGFNPTVQIGPAGGILQVCGIGPTVQFPME